MGRLNEEQLAAFVARTCERSGVSVKITDPGTVRDVVVLLSGRAGSVGASRPTGRPRSDPPGDIDAVRVEGSALDGGRGDCGVVDHGLDDRGLAPEIEGGPLSA